MSEPRCRHCFRLLRWHRLATVRMRCEREGGGPNSWGDPMTDEELACYEEMAAADEPTPEQQNVES